MATPDAVPEVTFSFDSLFSATVLVLRVLVFNISLFLLLEPQEPDLNPLQPSSWLLLSGSNG